MDIKTAFEISAEVVEVKNLKVGEKVKVLVESGSEVEVKMGVVVEISKFTSEDGEGTVCVQMLLITSDYWRPVSFSVVALTEKNQNKYQVRPLDKATQDVLVKEIESSLKRKISEKQEEMNTLLAHKKKLEELNFVKV